jgi:type III secretion system FlhB-like substrate exporter
MNDPILIFQNNQILIEAFDENLGAKTLKPLDDEHLEQYYNTTVNFAEELTVEGFMNALYPFFKKLDAQFVAYSNGFKLLPFYKQMQKLGNKKNDDLEYVEFYWACELCYMENIEEGTIDTDFSSYANYHGVSKKQDYNFSFSITPINLWKHLPLRLNTSYQCSTYTDKKGKLLKKEKIVFSTNKTFSLHHLLKCFISELTFFGYPENAKAVSEKLDHQVKEIKEGNVKTFSADELIMQMYETDYEKAIAEERYEAAARLMKKIKELENKNSI